MQPILGEVQHYAWGDDSWLPDFLGLPRDGRPWAEWWLGTHPNGPSRLADGTPLEAVSGPLPYLLKVLAVASPLSMQVHPDAEQAKAGYARGAYPDDRAKPELIVAITPFEALCGLRPAEASVTLLRSLGADRLADAVERDGPGETARRCLRGDHAVGPVVDACRSSARPEARWVVELDDLYPSEPSVLVALLLNQVSLDPGQALRLDAGHLHAYLRGTGVELMNASDNVVRAGLTPKPVDVDEVLAIFDPTPLDEPQIPASTRYDLPAADVSLHRLVAGDPHESTGHELAFDDGGRAWYLPPGDRAGFERDAWVVTHGSAVA